MIQLTDYATDVPFIVNHEKIARIDGDGKGGSFLYESLWDDTSFTRVAEPPKEVTRKILEHKLLVVKYKAYMQGAAVTDDPHDEDANLTTTSLVRLSLYNLAGLEE